MKSARPVAILSVLLCLACVALDSPALAGKAGRRNAIVGDYLVDQRDKRMVFLITVYEEGGGLYALTDIADYPVEMRPVSSDDRVYRIKYKQSGGFTLESDKIEAGLCTRLRMRSNTSEWECVGKRVEPELGKLRERYRQPRNSYAYHKPLRLNDGLEVGSIHDAGIDTTLLYQMMNDIHENREYMHSVLIIKDGKLVFEEYMNGWDPARLHRIQSVTKSFTSTVVGLAVEEGVIRNVDDLLWQYLPEYSSLFDGAKERITIRHLLTMSAGFEWNEGETYYDDPGRCDSHVAEAGDDYIRYVLEKPLATKPGSTWYYNSGYPNILGYIVEKQTGVNILEYTYERLLDPLGIERCCWMPIVGEDRPSCAGGLRLTSRDLAKYGCLYLDNGVWRGKRVIPRGWIKDSTAEQIDTGQGKGYGYLWSRIFVGNREIIFASGTGGQYVAYIPDIRAVVVTTAVYKTDKADDVAAMLLEYVVPAM
jgi:CubicO group peptidase (beta-lactamase class C family)